MLVKLWWCKGWIERQCLLQIITMLMVPVIYIVCPWLWLNSSLNTSLPLHTHFCVTLSSTLFGQSSPPTLLSLSTLSFFHSLLPLTMVVFISPTISVWISSFLVSSPQVLSISHSLFSPSLFPFMLSLDGVWSNSPPSMLTCGPLYYSVISILQSDSFNPIMVLWWWKTTVITMGNGINHACDVACRNLNMCVCVCKEEIK